LGKVQPTSILSYCVERPHLSKKQDVMFKKFQELYPTKVSDRDLVKILGWPINQVTPRRGELALKNLLEEFDPVFDLDTKRWASQWRLKK
jgi:hypothetical protein